MATSESSPALHPKPQSLNPAPLQKKSNFRFRTTMHRFRNGYQTGFGAPVLFGVLGCRDLGGVRLSGGIWASNGSLVTSTFPPRTR